MKSGSQESIVFYHYSYFSHIFNKDFLLLFVVLQLFVSKTESCRYLYLKLPHATEFQYVIVKRIIFSYETHGEKPNIPNTACVYLRRGRKQIDNQSLKRCPSLPIHNSHSQISADAFLLSANFQVPSPRFLFSQFLPVCGPLLTNVCS